MIVNDFSFHYNSVSTESDVTTKDVKFVFKDNAVLEPNEG